MRSLTRGGNIEDALRCCCGARQMRYADDSYIAAEARESPAFAASKNMRKSLYILYLEAANAADWKWGCGGESPRHPKTFMFALSESCGVYQPLADRSDGWDFELVVEVKHLCWL